MSENRDQKLTNSESVLDNSMDTNVKSEDQPNGVIREDMVKTAINFLMNPRVIQSPLTQKRTFLMKKGLTLEEIDLAIDRSNRLNGNQSLPPIMPNGMRQAMPSLPPSPSMPSLMSRSTQLVSNVTLFCGFLYGAYVLYKRFIEPLIFETKRKPHPFVAIQQQLDQLSKAMSLLQNNMSSLESNIRKQIEDDLRSIRAPEEITLHELKSELSSIKALLVNRRQFAATPVAGIPLWQLNDNNESNDKNSEDESNQQMNGSVEEVNNYSPKKLTNGSIDSIPTTDATTDALQD